MAHDVRNGILAETIVKLGEPVKTWHGHGARKINSKPFISKNGARKVSARAPESIVRCESRQTRGTEEPPEKSL